MNMEYQCATLQYQIDCHSHLFYTACQQLVLINNQILQSQVRYDRALSLGSRQLRYNYRLRLATLEAIRNQVYKIMCKHEDRVVSLENQLTDATVHHV